MIEGESDWNYFEVDLRDANPHPGTEVWFKVRTTPFLYTIGDGIPLSSLTHEGYPFLPSFNHKQFGQARGWPSRFSPILIKECYTIDPYRTDPPTSDEMLRVVWRSWEDYLIKQERSATSIVTPADAPPNYDPDYWLDFLEYQGYRSVNTSLWQKRFRQ